MEYVLYSTVIGVFFILTFITGLHYGQKIQRGEKIEMPQINPIKAVKESIKESKQTKEDEEKQKELQKFIDAMENYDGNVVR